MPVFTSNFPRYTAVLCGLHYVRAQEALLVKLRRTTFLVTLLLAPLACFADGNKLLQQCTSAEHFLDTRQIRDEHDIGMCLGMVQGVRNTMIILDSVLDKRLRLCWPEKGIDNGQAVRIVTRFLRSIPAKLHEDEVLLTMLAFRDAYPCK